MQVAEEGIDPTGDADEHFLLSTYREKIVEHRFVSGVLAALWHQGGYDVVFQARSIIRHVQLKSVKANASTASWKVALRLASYPSGCVVVIVSDPDTLAIGPFLWFGGEPGVPLPVIDHFKVAKHTKANADGYKAERPRHRVLPRSAFRQLGTIGEVAKALIDAGEVSASAFASPLNNAGLEGMLRRVGHPYVQISWRDDGLFEAVGHPGAKLSDAPGYAHQGDYLAVMVGIAQQVGMSAKVHDSGFNLRQSS